MAEDWLADVRSNPDARLAISGFDDPSGSAPLNAELSKNRAEAVQAARVGAGVAEARTDLAKLEVTTTTDLTPSEARRVEVTAWVNWSRSSRARSLCLTCRAPITICTTTKLFANFWSGCRMAPIRNLAFENLFSPLWT